MRSWENNLEVGVQKSPSRKPGRASLLKGRMAGPPGLDESSPYVNQAVQNLLDGAGGLLPFWNRLFPPPPKFFFTGPPVSGFLTSGALPASAGAAPALVMTASLIFSLFGSITVSLGALKACFFPS